MRRPIALALLIVALTAGAAWLVARLAPAPRPPRAAPALAEPQAGATGPMKARPIDPAEQQRVEELREARDRYAALRDAFAEGRPSPSSAARVQPVVAGLWPAPTRPEVTCRGIVCRVVPSPAPPGWQAALADHEGIRALAERLAIDPDASTTPAYLLLAPLREVGPPEPAPRAPAPVEPSVQVRLPESTEPSPREPVAHEAVPHEATPTPGKAEEFLRGVEATARASPELAACLASAEPGTILEVHLVIEGAALGHRVTSGPGGQPPPCAGEALAPLVAAPLPPGVTSGERAFRLERP